VDQIQVLRQDGFTTLPEPKHVPESVLFYKDQN